MRDCVRSCVYQRVLFGIGCAVAAGIAELWFLLRSSLQMEAAAAAANATPGPRIRVAKAKAKAD